jgi:hypothetical protein
MKLQLPKVGSIWTVPAVGRGSYCLILAGPLEILKNRPSYKVLPVRRAAGAFARYDEYELGTSATASGHTYIGSLFSVRDVPATALGKPLDLLTRASALDELRAKYASYLKSSPSKLGWWDSFSRRWEVSRWQRVTGALFNEPTMATALRESIEAHYQILLGEAIRADWSRLDITENLPEAVILALGGERVHIRVPMMYPETPPEYSTGRLGGRMSEIAETYTLSVDELWRTPVADREDLLACGGI